MQLRRCQPCETREVLGWIKERHYLKSTPPGFVCVLEVLEGKKRIGAMQIGRPTSRKLNPDKILELNRMYLVDEAPKNSESKSLSMMRKFIRCWYPQIRLMLAYSDPSQGHFGTIYEADGWAPFGETKHATGYGWKSRPNRKDDPVTAKIRWVRSP